MSCQVETILKMCPLVEQVCAVADSKQMFVVGLIVPNEAKVKAMQEKATGLPSTDFKEACQDKAVVKAFLAELTAHGLKCKWETEREGFHSSATEHPFAEVLVTLSTLNNYETAASFTSPYHHWWTGAYYIYQG